MMSRTTRNMLQVRANPKQDKEIRDSIIIIIIVVAFTTTIIVV
jgi:hypothetical protein